MPVTYIFMTFTFLAWHRHYEKGRSKLVLCTQTSPFSEMMRSCKCFPLVNKMPTLYYVGSAVHRMLSYFESIDGNVRPSSYPNNCVFGSLVLSRETRKYVFIMCFPKWNMSVIHLKPELE